MPAMFVYPLTFRGRRWIPSWGDCCAPTGFNILNLRGASPTTPLQLKQKSAPRRNELHYERQGAVYFPSRLERLLRYHRTLAGRGGDASTWPTRRPDSTAPA